MQSGTGQMEQGHHDILGRLPVPVRRIIPITTPMIFGAHYDRLWTVYVDVDFGPRMASCLWRVLCRRSELLRDKCAAALSRQWQTVDVANTKSGTCARKAIRRGHSMRCGAYSPGGSIRQSFDTRK